MNNTLYILCGLPGCGKSTWAQNRLKKNYGKPDPIWDYVSRDQVRFSIVKEEEDYFSKEKQVFYEYVKRIVDSLENNYVLNTIADATHLNEVSRDKLISAIKKMRPNLNFDIVMVYFDIPIEVCQFRNEKRTGRARVPENVINRMAATFEFPKCRKNLVRIEIVRD